MLKLFAKKRAQLLLLVTSLVSGIAQPQTRHGERIGPIETVSLRETSLEADSVLLAQAGKYRATLDATGYGTITTPEGNRTNSLQIPSRQRLVPVSNLPDLIAFETWVEQPGGDYQESISAGFSGVARQPGSVVIQRYVRDELRRVYLRYKITVEILPGKDLYRVSFGESSADPARLQGPPDWKVLLPSGLPVPQVMHGRDTVALVLYAPLPTGRRVMEYLHIGKLPLDRTFREEATRDFYAENGELTIAAPHLSINGEAQTPPVIVGSSTAQTMWLYVPRRGRFVLSLKENPELKFERAGEIRDKVLTFAMGGEIFRIECSDSIVAGSGTYAIHARNDSDWLPTTRYRNQSFIGSPEGAETFPVQ